MLLKHMTYWLLPGVFMSALLLMYFSGVQSLQDLVAPTVNREFGILEHTQLLLLLTVLAMSIAAAWREHARLRKLVFSSLALASAFLAVEEIDYGLHYWELLFGQAAGLRVRNIHNQGDLTDILKRISYVLIVVGFVVLPLARARINIGWVRDFIPSRWIICTAALLVVIPETAHLLDGKVFAGKGPLSGNISEFAETIIYYLLFVYVLELYSRQKQMIAGHAYAFESR